MVISHWFDETWIQFSHQTFFFGSSLYPVDYLQVQLVRRQLDCCEGNRQASRIPILWGNPKETIQGRLLHIMGDHFVCFQLTIICSKMFVYHKGSKIYIVFNFNLASLDFAFLRQSATHSASLRTNLPGWISWRNARWMTSRMRVMQAFQHIPSLARYGWERHTNGVLYACMHVYI